MLSVPCSGCCTASHPRRSSPQCLVLSHSHISLRSSQASACDYTPLPMIQATLDCPVAHSENHLEALGSSMLLCQFLAAFRGPLHHLHPFFLKWAVPLTAAWFPSFVDHTFPAAIATIRNTTNPMCVSTTWPLVNDSPAMALNVMLFFCHQFQNFCSMIFSFKLDFLSVL